MNGPWQVVARVPSLCLDHMRAQDGSDSGVWHLAVTGVQLGRPRTCDWQLWVWAQAWP